MNFPWLTDEEADELKRFQKHHDEDHQKSERQTKSGPVKKRAGPPSELLHERTTARPVSTFNTPPIF